MRNALAVLAMVSAMAAINPAANAQPTVQVSVQATEAHSNPLTFEWRVTDGRIVNTNGASMTWNLPAGPGLHFAYVLVSNRKGGYTERRIVVSTDDIGVPPVTPKPVNFVVPAAPAPVGNFYQSILRSGIYFSPVPGGGVGQDNDGVYTPNAQAYLDNGAGVKTAVARSDSRGFFTIPGVPDGTYKLYCRMDASLPFKVCKTGIVMKREAAFDSYQGPQSGRGDITGRLLLSDGTPCGTVNEFFGKRTGGRATLLNASGAVLAGPFRVNDFGHYNFRANPAAAKIRLNCEGAATVTIPIPSSPDVSARTLLADTAAPVVQAMSAKFNGVEVGVFLPPPSGLPSDNVAGADFFLSYKGLDSRLAACRYYLAVGAVKSCDAQGNIAGAISFDDWKRKTRMEPFQSPGRKDIVATFINRVDLNLTRNHHSISYGPDQTAAYVCNYLGPKDETQAQADIAIDNAVKGRNLVACVAMDHNVAPGVNGGKPFTRFLIFGPSGELLPSINLDGRREKFVPGVCVACHGGDRYAGKFPTAALGTTGAGSANIGAHFLPYDTGNFVFSSAATLTEAAQEEAIYRLNQNVLRAGPTIAAKELIQGWYAANHVLDKNYLPVSWRSQTPLARKFYKEVYAPSCRTCHVAFTGALNFDRFQNLNLAPSPIFETGKTRTGLAVCGGSASWLRNLSMPNSLQTLNLFWGTVGKPVDQPAIVRAFTGFPECEIYPSPQR